MIKVHLLLFCILLIKIFLYNEKYTNCSQLDAKHKISVETEIYVDDFLHKWSGSPNTNS